jgi:hypothetical protein
MRSLGEAGEIEPETGKIEKYILKANIGEINFNSNYLML